MDLKHILAKAIDVQAAFEAHPELFKFRDLPLHDKVHLMKQDAKTYVEIIAPHITSTAEKLYVLMSLGNNDRFKKLKLRFEISPTEIKTLNNGQYTSLLKLNFEKYIDKDMFAKLPKSIQTDFYLEDPVWFFEKLGIIPKLSAPNLSTLSQKFPDFVDKHILDYSNLSTYANFWEYMIRFNPKYENIFLKNTNSLVTKTDVRTVFRKFPRLIKKIDGDILANSKLTVKDWVLLTDSVMKENKRLFTNWKFSDDIKEIFRLDLVAEMLVGKSKISVRSQNAIDKVIKIVKEEDDEDNEIV
jgi:hypothetical protein